MAKKPFYVMVDVEASGPNLNRHSLLSWAACVVLPEMKSAQEMKDSGLVYYDELAPLWQRGFITEAMTIGCLGIRCLKKFKDDWRYDPGSPKFDPALVLKELEKSGAPPRTAVLNFMKWLRDMTPDGHFLILGSDTSLFDLPWIKYYFDNFGKSENGRDFLGHGGLNLYSLWMGIKKRHRVKKKEMELKDERAVAHCAEDDAIYLAQLASIALYKHCG